MYDVAPDVTMEKDLVSPTYVYGISMGFNNINPSVDVRLVEPDPKDHGSRSYISVSR